jgi:hypothetical protein
MGKYRNRTLFQIGVICLVLTGVQSFVAAQPKAAGVTAPQAKKSYRPLDTIAECTSRGGFWRDGAGCHLVLENAVKISNLREEVPYPKTEKSCRRVAGIWSSGKCAVIYSQLVTSSQLATRQGVTPSRNVLLEKTGEKEKCNESGGAWVLNNGEGFCYTLISPEVCTLSMMVCTEPALPPMNRPK